MEHINGPDELRDAPLLSKLRGSDPFVTPEGFFERFPQEVQQRIRSRERSGWSLRPMFRPAWVIGTTVAVLMLTVFMVLREPTTTLLKTELTEEPAWMPDELLVDTWNADQLLAEIAAEEGTVTGVAHDLNAEELAAYIEHDELPIDLILEEL
jgi:hypothetical protein